MAGRSSRPDFNSSGRTPFFSLSQSFSDRNNVHSSTIDILGHDHSRRITDYKTAWKFYEGDHWGEANYDHTKATFNYARRIVDIKSMFLSQNSFSIQVPELPPGTSEKDIRSFVKNKLDYHWKFNRKDQWLHMCAQTGSVTGDAFVRALWKAPEVKEVTLADGSTEEVEAYPGFVNVDVIPSSWVFPEFHPTDASRIDGVWIIFNILEEKVTAKGLLKRRLERSRDVVLYKEYWTADRFEVYLDNDIINEGDNPIGKIPIIHIQNFPNSNGYFGISDMQDIIPIQRQINEKATDVSDVIDYHGSPQTIMKGARPEDLERGPDKIWSVPKESDVFNLELKGDLKGNLAYYESLKETMLDISGVPAQAMNPTNNISNTPGVALHISYLPLIQNRQIKIIQYGQGIKDINELILRWAEVFEPEFAAEFSAIDGPEKYDTEIDFGEALPRDQRLRLGNAQMRLDMGIASRAEIVMEERGVSREDADRIIAEADADTKKRAEITALIKASGSPGGAFGNQRQPDPIIQGDKVSQNASFK